MSSFKLITCMLTKKGSVAMIRRLKDEKGIITANITYARGTSSKSLYRMKVVEIMTVLISQERADEIFDYLYRELKLFQPHQGMIYQEAVKRSTGYTLPILD